MPLEHPDEPELPTPASDPESVAAPRTARGLRRWDLEGGEWIDALSGRVSIFGYGHRPLVAAVRTAAEHLGEGTSLGPVSGLGQADVGPASDPLVQQFARLTCDGHALQAESAAVFPSADAAVDALITCSRRRGDASKYRTVTLVGSDHGRGGWCRVASGRPEFHHGLGPLVAGFDHVPVGDTAALRAVIDERTSLVLFSPVDWSDGVRPLEASYLRTAQELCQSHDAIFAFDESLLCFAAGGKPFSFSEIADVHADAVVVGGGLLAGQPGGLLLASSRLNLLPDDLPDDDLSLIRRLVETSLSSLEQQRVLNDIQEQQQSFAVTLAELIGGFQFIRDVHVLGFTIGIELDLPAAEFIQAAASQRLLLASSGEHAVCLQLPLVVESDDRDELLRRLEASCEIVERAPESVPLE